MPCSMEQGMLCDALECFKRTKVHQYNVTIVWTIREEAPKCGKNRAIMALHLTIGLWVVRNFKNILDAQIAVQVLKEACSKLRSTV